MNLWRAFAVAVCLAVIAVVLLFAMAVKVEPQTNNQFQVIKCMPDDETKEKVRQVMLTALDDALQEHIENAFGVMLRDDRDQPRRAANGIRQGIRAYVNARWFVLKWSPPLCATTSP